ncbi:MAG: glycosyltransferase [Solirubrobacteraceae bacterium]|nr:glycosyltransferase [Solirubrobacteraceae bacterium]
MSRVLVVDEAPPQPGRDGGSARMVALLELLIGDGHRVCFASIRPWSDDLLLPRRRVEELGVEVVASDGDVAGYLATAGTNVDVVILSRLPVASALLGAARAHAPRAQVVYDAVHAEHLARYRLAKLAGNAPLLAAALTDRAAEAAVVAAVDGLLATSEEDATALQALGPQARVAVVPAVHASGDASPPSGRRHGLVFLGFLEMPENAIAARRLVDEIWPRIERLAGPTPLTILGACPPAWLSARAACTPRLSAPGHLPDVDAPLRHAAALVVPLRGGAGVKSKVLHAFGRWLPVVASTDGLRGTQARDGVHALVGESDDELAEASARVLGDPSLGKMLAGNAAELLRTHFGVEANRAALRTVLEGVHG